VSVTSLRPLLLCALAGAFFALAAPPANAYVALWIGMAALAWMLSPKSEALRGLAFGFGANVVALRFVPDVIARFTPLPWAAGLLALALLALFEGLRWMAAALLCRGAMRLGLPSWAAFAIGVYAGTFVPTIFPWSAASGVTPWPAMVELADLVGERGVTLLMALTSGLVASGVRAVLARATRMRGVAALAIAIAIPLVTFAYGARRMREVEALRAAAPTVKIVLVQPSIAASERWEAARAASILTKLVELTKSAERKGAELTVWPEAAYPYPLPHANRRAPIGELAILPYGVHGPVLTGVVLTEGRSSSYNSAFIATADGALTEPQDKQHLLWFGETVPFADRSAWLRRTFARGVGLAPGDHTVLQSTGRVRAGILNCFEDTLPDAGREIATASPNLLINITNDAWFKGSGESELHLRLAALRAVELRRDLVRAVNFGPTSWIDATGRVRARYASDIPGTLLAEPALLELPATMYARFGDAPLLAALLALAAAALVRRRSLASTALKREGRRTP
jgi:apolipoprotein N-acyltransferase